MVQHELHAAGGQWELPVTTGVVGYDHVIVAWR